MGRENYWIQYSGIRNSDQMNKSSGEVWRTSKCKYILAAAVLTTSTQQRELEDKNTWSSCSPESCEMICSNPRYLYCSCIVVRDTNSCLLHDHATEHTQLFFWGGGFCCRFFFLSPRWMMDVPFHRNNIVTLCVCISCRRCSVWSSIHQRCRSCLRHSEESRARSLFCLASQGLSDVYLPQTAVNKLLFTNWSPMQKDTALQE